MYLHEVLPVGRPATPKTVWECPTCHRRVPAFTTTVLEVVCTRRPGGKSHPAAVCVLVPPVRRVKRRPGR